MALEPSGEDARVRLAVSIAVRVILCAFGIAIAIDLAWRLRLLCLLVLVSLFLAALLEPIVQWLVAHRFRRGIAVFGVYLGLAAFVLGLSYAFFDTLIGQATHFAHVLPRLVHQAEAGKGAVGQLITRLHLGRYIAAHSSAIVTYVSKLGRPALAVGKTVLSGVTSMITILFLSFFILLEAPRLLEGFLRLLRPDHAYVARRIVSQMSQQVTGFMAGNLATSVIAGAVSFVALVVMGVPFAMILAVWTALVDFLPLVGGLLAGVPVVGVAFLHSVPAGVVTVVVFLAYQQVENHVLNPLIISRTLRLNPLLVLVSVILGAEIGAIIGSTFGAICGAIFALPAAGGLQVVLRELAADGFIFPGRLVARPQTRLHDE